MNILMCNVCIFSLPSPKVLLFNEYISIDLFTDVYLIVLLSPFFTIHY